MFFRQCDYKFGGSVMGLPDADTPGTAAVAPGESLLRGLATSTPLDPQGDSPAQWRNRLELTQRVG